MATAEELFSSLNLEEPHIIINSDRTVTIPDELKNAAVQYDHNIETVTFDCPRYWDGNDLSEMIVSINYERSDGHEGSYTCKNVVVDGNDSNIMHFDWTISNDATQVAGDLVFIVCVKKEHIDGYTSQVWHSQRCETFSVIKGLKCIQAPIIPSDPEYSGVQADYNQNSETAADYIKNRPFYKESKVFTFPDADYNTPAYSDSDGDMALYKVSDEPIDVETFEGSTLTAHAGEDSVVAILTQDGEDANLSEEHNEETGKLYQVTIFDSILILYEPLPLNNDITVLPGIYSMTTLSDESSQPIVIDSMEVILKLKKIDESFIPPLDYASKQSVKDINTQVVSANIFASGAHSMAETAKSNAKNAIDTANKTQTDLNTLKTKVDNVQKEAFSMYGLHIDNASYMFFGSAFMSSPIKYFASNRYVRTFSNCFNMTKCYIYSAGIYKPTSIDCMFYYCTKLKEIKSSDIGTWPCLDLSECTSAYLSFYNCASLTTIDLITSIKISLDFSWCPLDDKTADMILSNLLPVTEAQTITFKSNILEKITDEQLAKVPSGWIIK